MEFKDRVKELRLEHALTQAQLATKIEKGEAAIRTWETGRAKPDSDTLIKLAKLFDCSVDYLLGISSSKKISPIHEIDSTINSLNNLINQKKEEFAQIEVKIMELDKAREASSKERTQKIAEICNLQQQVETLNIQKTKLEKWGLF